MPSPRPECLLIIDVQNDFCPGGALAVPDGDEVVEVINRLGERFAHRVLTQDWHPAGHLSFASSHPGRAPMETTTLAYGEQVLWPDHCVQGTPGAEFHSELEVNGSELILRKGFRREIDSYSAFFENDRTTPTGLGAYFHERGFKRLGIIYQDDAFGRGYSALDARRAGFHVTMVEDACRGIDVSGSLAAAWQQMESAGVERVTSEALARA